MKVKSKLIGQNFETVVTVGQHLFKVDEPIEKGGGNLGPTPMEYLSASLASCTLITLKMYINHKRLPINEIHADVERKLKSNGKTSIFDVKITFTGQLDEKQRERLLRVAHACPVHKILAQGSEVKITLM